MQCLMHRMVWYLLLGIQLWIALYGKMCYSFHTAYDESIAVPGIAEDNLIKNNSV